MLPYILIAVLAEIIIAFSGILFFFSKSEVFSRYSKYLINFSAGTFLGVVFFDLMPEAVELSPAILGDHTGFIYILAGFLTFFLISRLFSVYHHHHETDEDEIHPKTKQNGYKVLMADILHNFVDGIVIVSAFMVSVPLGIATTVAVLIHEFPQEVSDFFVLIESGFSRGRALLLNFLVSISTLAGALAAFFMLSQIEGLVGPILGFAAGNFLYIAASDLIPEIHSHHKKGARTVIQIGLLLTAIAIMFAVSLIAHE